MNTYQSVLRFEFEIINAKSSVSSKSLNQFSSQSDNKLPHFCDSFLEIVANSNTYRGSPPYAHFGTWKKPCYMKLVLVGL